MEKESKQKLINILLSILILCFFIQNKHLQIFLFDFFQIQIIYFPIIIIFSWFILSRFNNFVANKRLSTIEVFYILVNLYLLSVAYLNENLNFNF